MRILVTGSAGFIGAEPTQRLLAHFDHVHAAGNHNSYYDSKLKEARLARFAGHPNYAHQQLTLPIQLTTLRERISQPRAHSVKAPAANATRECGRHVDRYLGAAPGHELPAACHIEQCIKDFVQWYRTYYAID